MRDKILIPYAPILVESTRSIGYSFEAAIADIIDNSIGKGAKTIDINFKSVGNRYIAIIDDACGMDEKELENAMRYGSKSSLDERDKSDLGRFGLGLKMASMSQCRKLTVISKKNGKICAARWDLDYIIEKGDWALNRLNDEAINKLYHIEKLTEYDSGTIILWENFDRLTNGSINQQKIFEEKIDLARSHVSLVFHRFMGDENFSKIKILFNNNRVNPVDPFLTSNAATQPLLEETITIKNSQIKVKPYILPYYSKLSAKDKRQMGDINDLRQNQGFYIYRNKRLIVWGTWFRLIKQHELNKLARIRVDIPNTLDSIWQIDIKKSTASLPDSIKHNLVAIVENTVGKSVRVYKYRGRNIKNDSLQHIWNPIENRGTYQYRINRELTLYKMLEDNLNEKGIRYLDSFIKTIEDSFPYSDVYFRMAKNENDINTTSLEYEEVYNVANDMIESIKSINGDISMFLDNIDTIDFFMKYPNVVKDLREEYK